MAQALKTTTSHAGEGNSASGLLTAASSSRGNPYAKEKKSRKPPRKKNEKQQKTTQEQHSHLPLVLHSLPSATEAYIPSSLPSVTPTPPVTQVYIPTTQSYPMAQAFIPASAQFNESEAQNNFQLETADLSQLGDLLQSI